MKKNITESSKQNNVSDYYINTHNHNQYLLSNNKNDTNKIDETVNNLYDQINNMQINKHKKKQKSVKINENNNYYFIPSIEYKECINNYNKIELLTCGNDLTIINSCNLYNTITYDQISEFKKILSYLMKNNIDSYRQSHIQFKINMPIYIKNKWIELSPNIIRCFSITNDDYKPTIYIPNTLNKSQKYNINGVINEPVNNNENCLNLVKKHYTDALQLYENLIKNNVNIETAMSVLPQSTYINFVETGTIYDYYMMYKNHNNNLKQTEIHEYISAINNILQKKYPESWNLLINNN